MKKFYILLLAFILIGTFVFVPEKAVSKEKKSVLLDKALGIPLPEDKLDSVFQISTLDAYVKGYYKSGQDAINISKKYGDFGFGLLKENSGIIIYDTKNAFKIKDFQVSQIDKYEYIPVAFGIFKYFDTDDRISVKNAASFEEFIKKTDEKLETVNYFIAIKANGKFKSISIQTENNETKILQNVKGELIGYRIPDFYSGTAKSGYTLFFVSDDKLFGGKVSEMNAELVSFYIDYSSRMDLILPKYKNFKVKDFSMYQPQVKEEKVVKNNSTQKDMQKIMNASQNDEPAPEDLMQLVAPKMNF